MSQHDCERDFIYYYHRICDINCRICHDVKIDYVGDCNSKIEERQVYGNSEFC